MIKIRKFENITSIDILAKDNQLVLLAKRYIKASDKVGVEWTQGLDEPYVIHQGHRGGVTRAFRNVKRYYHDNYYGDEMGQGLINFIQYVTDQVRLNEEFYTCKS